MVGAVVSTIHKGVAVQHQEVFQQKHTSESAKPVGKLSPGYGGGSQGARLCIQLQMPQQACWSCAPVPKTYTEKTHVLPHGQLNNELLPCKCGLVLV